MRPKIAISCGLYGDRTRIRPSITYAESIWKTGGLPFYAPAAFSDHEWADHVLEMADGVVLTGGGDVDPSHYGMEPSESLADVVTERDEIEIRIITEAARREIPLLAICRGCQILNVTFGGTLFQDVPADRPSATAHGLNPDDLAEDKPAHSVSLVPGSRVAHAYATERVEVNSMHHQAIRRLGNGLVATGAAPDGLVEAIEANRGWVVGVQWHPERMTRRYSEHLSIFRALVDESARRKREQGVAI